VALAAAVLLIVLATALSSSTTYIIGSVLDGVGFGAAVAAIALFVAVQAWRTRPAGGIARPQWVDQGI
jgi:hypothetical protein